MQIDQKTLNRLLSMNDERLAAVIQKIAADAGIDPALLGLDTSNIEKIRQALGSATQSDLDQLGAIYDTYRKNREK